MKNSIAIIVSAFVIFGLVLLAGRKFNLSTRYERLPQRLNSWSAQDNGIDPSDGIDA